VRLGVDATSVAPDGKGIARVQRGTVEALARLGRHELVVFARHPEELSVPAVRVAPRLTLAWEQRGLARAVREHRLDVMLTWTERLPVVGGGRYAVWLFEPPTHRIAHNRAVGAPAWQRGSDLVTQALWRRSLRRAALVLTGSQATADAIPVPALPLYPGLDPGFGPAPGLSDVDVPLQRRGDGEYVLAILTNDPRDDPETVLAAARTAGLPLRVAGGWRGPAQDGVEYLGRVSDDELLALYQGAAAYLDGSLYEGFGFQVLEAMACGTPVAATAVTSIPEITAGAAALAPPRSPGRLAEALLQVLAEPDEWRARGLARAAEFTWERTARELSDALEPLA
jgi:glycosyltransferase involved in cell wall biosynthesis